MTAVMPPAGHVRTLTLDEVRYELARLTKEVEASGYSLSEFKNRGDQWELDAEERGLLADVLSLEGFLNRSGR